MKVLKSFTRSLIFIKSVLILSVLNLCNFVFIALFCFLAAYG